MPRKTIQSVKLSEQGGIVRWNEDLLTSAFHGENAAALVALDQGADVDATHTSTGLTALHIAVGTNNLELAHILSENYEASFIPDRFGRWPSVVAAECQASAEIQDYIAEAEARYLARQDSSEQT